MTRNSHEDRGDLSTEPHDSIAEKAVLGSMMLNVQAIAEVTSILASEADYYLPVHREAHAAIVALNGRGQPPDPVSVAHELRRRGQLRAETDLPYLHSLTEAAVPMSAGHHARIVRECAERRDLHDQGNRLARDAINPGVDPVVLRVRVMDSLAAQHAGEDQQVTGPHLAAIPEYPVAALCGPLKELVESARSAGLLPALVGGAGLAALATAAGMADLAVTRTWTERPTLWVPLVAPRGAGKTPAQQYAYLELRRLDTERHRVYADELAAWLDEKPKDRGKRPTDPTRLIDDVTQEKTARWLYQGDGTGGIDVDELSGWLRRMGRYQSSGDGGERGRWLSLWSATPWRYQRVGDDIDIPIGRPVVPICGGIQPALHHLLGGEEDGLRPRWLPHIAQIDTSLEPGDGYAEQWDDVIRRLYDARQPRTWTLEGSARDIWLSARTRWKKESAEGNETASVSGALAKADVQAARIALVIAESLAPAKGGPVPEEAVTAAVAIADYVLGCWRAMPDREALTTSRTQETLHRGVDQVVDWLEQHGGQARRRDLLQAHVAGVRTKDDLDALLTRYEAEYPGSVRTERPKGRGRPPQMVYAPRRGSRSPQEALPETPNMSPGDKMPSGEIHSDGGKVAGSGHDAEPDDLVATGNKADGNKVVATKYATERGGKTGDAAVPFDIPDEHGEWTA